MVKRFQLRRNQSSSLPIKFGKASTKARTESPNDAKRTETGAGRRAPAGGEPRGDFWDKVQFERGPGNRGDGVSLDEGSACFLILAGAETTATMQGGAAGPSGRNIRVLHRLVQEIRSVFATGEQISLNAIGELFTWFEDPLWMRFASKKSKYLGSGGWNKS